jgi:hypothetical protein
MNRKLSSNLSFVIGCCTILGVVVLFIKIAFFESRPFDWSWILSFGFPLIFGVSFAIRGYQEVQKGD